MATHNDALLSFSAPCDTKLDQGRSTVRSLVCLVANTEENREEATLAAVAKRAMESGMLSHFDLVIGKEHCYPSYTYDEREREVGQNLMILIFGRERFRDIPQLENVTQCSFPISKQFFSRVFLSRIVRQVVQSL